jgi:hypothetical protein
LKTHRTEGIFENVERRNKDEMEVMDLIKDIQNRSLPFGEGEGGRGLWKE